MPTTVENDLQTQVSSVDWEFDEADTRELTHGVHRYSGKFIPQIARTAIELLSRPGEVVLDPYCGSGTTLLEAMLCNRNAIGIDLNPLAVLIARTKCRCASSSKLKKLISAMQEVVWDLDPKSQASLFDTDDQNELLSQVYADARFKDEWYRKWFDEAGLVQLIGIHRAITSMTDADMRDIGMLALSDILRRCSHAAGGYPNVMYDKSRRRRPLPAPLFLNRLKEVTDSIRELDRCDFKTSADVVHGDAQATGLEENSIDAVVTHPPYIGSIPYAEYGCLSLTWLGYDAKDLDKRLTGGKRQAADVVERFVEGFGGMIREAFRVLKRGRHMFMLVGHPLVRGKRVNLSDIAIDLASTAGFELSAREERKGMNRRANKMGSEDLLFFRKPKRLSTSRSQARV